MGDKIFINDLVIACIIGVNEPERDEKQPVIINVVLWTSTVKAGKTDRLTETIDYKNLYSLVVSEVEQSSFFLLEALAEHIARLCLKDKRVKRVQIRVEKPKALRLARSAAVEIMRKK